jgi:hypothetical protein
MMTTLSPHQESPLPPRHPARTAAAVSGAVLVCLAFAACGPGRSEARTPAPGRTLAPTAGPGSAGGASPDPDTTGAPGGIRAPGTAAATPDPLASALDQINALINDINNSLSNSDSSEQSGE